MTAKSRQKLVYILAAAAAVGAFYGLGEAAFAAAPNANRLVSNVVSSSSGFSRLISVLGYVGGTALGVAGIYRLKQHVDNPANPPMREGIIRLVVGGMLLSLPFMMNVMKGSVDHGRRVPASIAKVQNFGATIGAAGGNGPQACDPAQGCGVDPGP